MCWLWHKPSWVGVVSMLGCALRYSSRQRLETRAEDAFVDQRGSGRGRRRFEEGAPPAAPQPPPTILFSSLSLFCFMASPGPGFRPPHIPAFMPPLPPSTSRETCAGSGRNLAEVRRGSGGRACRVVFPPPPIYVRVVARVACGACWPGVLCVGHLHPLYGVLLRMWGRVDLFLLLLGDIVNQVLVVQSVTQTSSWCPAGTRSVLL